MKNSVMGLTPRFCVVNDTKQDIDVRCRNVKVNGKECKTDDFVIGYGGADKK